MTTIECHFFACLINLLWKCVICQDKLWYDVSRQQNPVLIHKCTTISRKKMPKNKTCWVLSCSMLPRHFSKIIIIWLPNLQKKANILRRRFSFLYFYIYNISLFFLFLFLILFVFYFFGLVYINATKLTNYLFHKNWLNKLAQ